MKAGKYLLDLATRVSLETLAFPPKKSNRVGGERQTMWVEVWAEGQELEIVSVDNSWFWKGEE